jgi:GH35 family endo-1,4-beta-xylanase
MTPEQHNKGIQLRLLWADYKQAKEERKATAVLEMIKKTKNEGIRKGLMRSYLSI